MGVSFSDMPIFYITAAYLITYHENQYKGFFF